MKLKKGYSCSWRNSKGILFLIPGFLGVSFFVLIPFGDVVRRSFFTAMSGEFTGMKNYAAVFQNTAFRLAAVNTLKFTVVCLPLLLLISLILALLMNQFIRLERFKSFYLLPMAVPAATVVLVWRMLFARQGFLNAWLESHVNFMGENAAFRILVGSYIWKNLGYTLVLWLAGLKAIPTDMTEAARVDGANWRQCLFGITLPNLKGSMYTITVLSFLNSFKVFREAYLVSGSYPQEKIYLIQHLFQNWYTGLDLDKLSAGAVLTALVLGSVALLLQRIWENEDGYEK